MAQHDDLFKLLSKQCLAKVPVLGKPSLKDHSDSRKATIWLCITNEIHLKSCTPIRIANTMIMPSATDDVHFITDSESLFSELSLKLMSDGMNQIFSFKTVNMPFAISSCFAFRLAWDWQCVSFFNKSDTSFLFWEFGFAKCKADCKAFGPRSKASGCLQSRKDHYLRN